jgi:hypothetical protein
MNEDDIYLPLADQIPFAPELASLSTLDAALLNASKILGFQHDLHGTLARREPDTNLAHEIDRHARILRELIAHYAFTVLGE